MNGNSHLLEIRHNFLRNYSAVASTGSGRKFSTAALHCWNEGPTLFTLLANTTRPSIKYVLLRLSFLTLPWHISKVQRITVRRQQQEFCVLLMRHFQLISACNWVSRLDIVHQLDIFPSAPIATNR